MSLPNHRKAIDRIDAELLQLLSRRAHEVREIGRLKQEKHEPIRSPEREHALLERLKRLNKGPYSDLAIEAIFREVISASLALEMPLKVAYLGPETTFSHQAALTAFGHSAELVPQQELSQVFEEVAKGSVQYGVVPIENSVEGVVHQSLDLLVKHPLSICAEIYLPVRHCLLSRGGSLSEIKKIYSHPQAWGQCSLWLKSHGFDYRHFEEVSSTAKAAERARDDATSAAIASREAAALYALTVQKANIQDSASNQTRFVVVGFDSPARTGKDKTTIVFQAESRVGFLAEALQILARAKINLSKIESRPSRGKDWEYSFYVDMEGHRSDKRVAGALLKLEARSSYFRHLGSYPRYDSIDLTLHKGKRS